MHLQSIMARMSTGCTREGVMASKPEPASGSAEALASVLREKRASSTALSWSCTRRLMAGELAHAATGMWLARASGKLSMSRELASDTEASRSTAGPADRPRNCRRPPPCRGAAPAATGPGRAPDVSRSSSERGAPGPALWAPPAAKERSLAARRAICADGAAASAAPVDAEKDCSQSLSSMSTAACCWARSRCCWWWSCCCC
ncbi:hypothetical protein H696_02492 [Fonticula alba]|uniref:Uncharacterized protein n=1 Tax=Fonticula alba TaxID=691883 RepID=A0A058ZDL2_FONAL|nr:hypothetical protein H696_02492 [Fonticula alba]KCV71552.1 hypothetical protein H696_02492 [Fonticula alba]|eukprot:XP_009494675.1 hypothetical protein H696_02492 [Fonticula alba]